MEFYLLYRFITLEHLNNNLISLYVNVRFTVYLHFVVFPVDSAVQKSVVKCFHVLSGTHTLLCQQIQKVLTLRLPISSLFTSQSSIFWKRSEHCQAVLTKTHFARVCYYMWISSELYLCHMLSVLLILYASIIGLWLNPMQIFARLLLYLHLSRASFLPIINECAFCYIARSSICREQGEIHHKIEISKDSGMDKDQHSVQNTLLSFSMLNSCVTVYK